MFPVSFYSILMLNDKEKLFSNIKNQVIVKYISKENF